MICSRTFYLKKKLKGVKTNSIFVFSCLLQCTNFFTESYSVFIKYLISVILSFTAYQYTYTYDRKTPTQFRLLYFQEGGGLSFYQCNFLVLHEKWFSEYWILKTYLKYILTWLFSWIFNSCIYFLFDQIFFIISRSFVSISFLFGWKA